MCIRWTTHSPVLLTGVFGTLVTEVISGVGRGLMVAPARLPSIKELVKGRDISRDPKTSKVKHMERFGWWDSD